MLTNIKKINEHPYNYQYTEICDVCGKIMYENIKAQCFAKPNSKEEHAHLGCWIKSMDEKYTEICNNAIKY